MTPTSREAWESLTSEQLAEYTDLQLKKGLRAYFGLRSHVYFMPVAQKRQYIMEPDSRPTIQAEAEKRQKAHKDAGAAHSGKKPVKELIAERSEDSQYQFVGVDRPQGGFTDPFNDRKGAVAYVIRDTADGEEYPTQKQTCKTLTDMGKLAGFDASVTAKKQKPAHKAGFSTFEDVIAGGDPKVKEAVKEITKPIAEPEPIAPISSDSGSALDDILNSIPQ